MSGEHLRPASSEDSPPRSIITLDANQIVLQWPSGTLIVFERGQRNVRDLWMVNISDPENPEARPYLTSEADLERITVSPDGRLAAYRSDESGSDEVYVRSFPVPGERTVIARGTRAILGWSPDGRSLYWGAATGQPVYVTRLEPRPVPRVVRTDTLSSVLGPPIEPRVGVLHPHGDRFVFTAVPAGGGEANAEAAPERIVLVQNFVEELERMVAN